MMVLSEHRRYGRPERRAAREQAGLQNLEEVTGLVRGLDCYRSAKESPGLLTLQQY